MGACILCGKSAGPFYSLHKNCYSKYQASKQEIASFLYSGLGVAENSQLAGQVKQQIADYQFTPEAQQRTLNRALEYFSSEYIDITIISISELNAWMNLLDELSPDVELFVNPHFLVQQYNLPAIHELSNSSLPASNRHAANYSLTLHDQESLWWCFDNCEIEQDSSQDNQQQWSVLTQLLGSLLGRKHKPKLLKKSLADGRLLVTSHRLYFESDTFIEQLEYQNIYSLTPMKNGIRIQSKENSAKPKTYVCEDARLLFAFIKYAQKITS